jgi:hypothetical protein
MSENEEFIRNLKPKGTWNSDKKIAVIEKIKEDEAKIEVLN